ncbi:MAG: hypothetical protein ACRYGF_09010 [Janthinobacterium lividum]
MSSIGTRHPNRVAGLIYLDASSYYAYQSDQSNEMKTLIDKLVSRVGPLAFVEPTAADLANFASFQLWTWTSGVSLSQKLNCARPLKVIKAAGSQGPELLNSYRKPSSLESRGSVKSTNKACLDGASLDTSARVYVSFMQRNPALLDEAKALGVVMALKDSYSCPK